MNKPDTAMEGMAERRPGLPTLPAHDDSNPVSRKPRTIALMATLLFAFPLFAISVDHWASGIYYLIAMLALFAVRRPEAPLCREERFLIGVLLFYLSVTLISNTLGGWTSASIGWYEADLRFVLALPVFLFLRRHPQAAVALLQAVPVAGLLSGAYVIHQTGWAGARVEGPYGPIFAGNVAALFAVMSLATLRYSTYPPRIKVPLHLLGFALALTAALVSGTRSAWLAAAVSLPILLFFMAEGGLAKRLRRRLVLGAVTLVAAALIVAVAIEPRLTQHRFTLAVQQAVDFLSAETVSERAEAAEGSIGIRLEQWRVGLLIAAEHPFFGVGVGNAGPLFNRHVEAGTASPTVRVHNLDTGRGSHLHSAYFDALVFKGAFGFAALLCVLLYPLWLALTLGRGTRARLVLVALSATFLIFSLTEDPFIRNNFTSVYLIFLVCALALLFTEAAGRAPRGAKA